MWQRTDTHRTSDTHWGLHASDTHWSFRTSDTHWG